MRIWCATHRMGHQEDYLVHEDLAVVLGEVACLMGKPTAAELGRLIAISIADTICTDPKSPLAPQRIIARIAVPASRRRKTRSHATIEVRAFDTADREWFGTLTRE